MGCGASKWGGDESTMSKEVVEAGFRAAVKAQIDWAMTQLTTKGCLFKDGGDWSYQPGHGIPGAVTGADAP